MPIPPSSAYISYISYIATTDSGIGSIGRKGSGTPL
jgi:hypothetical protein